jgi:hypothetical protein
MAHIMEFPMTELDDTDMVDAADLYGEETAKAYAEFIRDGILRMGLLSRGRLRGVCTVYPHE